MPESFRYLCKNVLKISWADVDPYLELGNVAINKMKEKMTKSYLTFFGNSEYQSECKKGYPLDSFSRDKKL